MDFWIVFIFVFLMIHFVQLHYKAGKRIRALEKSLSEMMEVMSRTTDIVKRNHDLLESHDKELLHMRIKLRGIK